MTTIADFIRKSVQHLMVVLVLVVAVGTVSSAVHGQVIHRVCVDSSCDWSSGAPSLFYTDLQAAIDAAGPNEHIWVAAGTYLPTDGCDAIHPLECSFELPAGVTLYGNFCGDEAGVDVAVRDPLNSQCITTLDGQFGIDPEDGRVLHVVRADTAGQHYIDGFTITRGWARGWSRVEEESGLPILPPAKGSSGGGMLVCSTASVV